VTQIALVLFGAFFLWEGAKGFRSCGIKVGLFKADSEPLTGTKGKVVGSFVILVGVAMLLVALVYVPLQMRR
jgi:hypothetical protein